MAITVCNGIKECDWITPTKSPRPPTTNTKEDVVPVENTENDINDIPNLQELIDKSKINLNGKIII